MAHASETIATEPIAIVGIGCRLPGGADSADALWRLLDEQVDAIGPIPDDRFDVAALYDPRPATPGRIMSRWGGHVDHIDEFDAGFFETAPREAERLDPQQRLLLETSWEALEDAGLPRETIAGTNAGVFVGMWINEFESRMFADSDRIDFHMTTGTGRYAASGRLSYFLDLLGPSITVDTACSSSLVAVHLACQSLSSGECDVALAGGANVIVEPFITVAYSQSRMMAPDGRCKFGDAAANGYVRSDGAVVVALKRLSRAQAHGDRVYAVIRGSAVTNDGRSSGFMATPGRAGQEEMLRRAYARAGVDPRSVQYVEAHGTGTAAGDPVEVGALGAVVGADRPTDRPCLVGSIKSNIGHTEGAAGAAGLAKVALALHHGRIPASLHVQRPNPEIPWDELGMRLATTEQPWPDGPGPRRGAVSAFGIAGTNAHAVLEEAPPALARGGAGPLGPPYLLAVAAADPGALDVLGERYAAALADAATAAGELCAAATNRRSHLACRRAVVGADASELASELRRHAGTSRPALAHPKVVFVFPGQGSQWPGMARQLLAGEPAFAAALARCDAAIRAEAGWSPIEMLTAPPTPRLDEIDTVQPLLFAVDVALAAQWRAWGIEPDAVVGHSMGEVAAAHVVGALDLDDAVAVICRRSALLRRVSGQGAMAVVDLPAEAAHAALAGREHLLSVAVSNSHRSTVISGDPAALAEVLGELESADVFCRPVKVDVASHSPQMDPLLADLRAALAHVRPRPAAIPFHSTVTGGELDGGRLDADYWCDNLRRPVRFGDVVERLVCSGHDAFVELSPHPILLPAVEQVIAAGGADVAVVASLRRDADERGTMLAGLGELYERGATPRWPAVVGVASGPVALPSYPWQRERFWYDRPHGGRRRAGDHPLLGHAVASATDAGAVVFETEFDPSQQAFLADHVVRGWVVVPAAAFVELIRAAAGTAWPGERCRIDGLAVHEILPLGDAGCAIQVTWRPQGERSAHVQVHAASTVDGEGTAWRLYASATVGRATASDAGAALLTADPGAEVAAEDGAHAAAMRRRGLRYGPAFLTVDRCRIARRPPGAADAGSAVAHLAVDGGVPSAERAIRLVDGALQVLLAALPADVAPDATFVPVGIDEAHLADLDVDAAWATASVTAVDENGRDGPGARGDVVMTGDDGTVLARLRGVRLARLGAESDLDALVHEFVWQAAAAPVASDGAPSAWLVLADGPLGEDVGARLAASGRPCRVEHASATSDDDLAEIVASCCRAAGGPLGVVEARAVAGTGAPGAGASALQATSALVRVLSTTDHPPGVRLWMVTEAAIPDAALSDDNAEPAGCQPDGDRAAVGDGDVEAPVGALRWGFLRVAAAELPSLHPTLVDIGPGDLSALVEELLAAPGEAQVRRRGGQRMVPRLRRNTGWRSARDTRTTTTDEVRLVASTPGSLDGLVLRPQPRRAPGAGEVEIRVAASGLNFIDVMKAMDVYPGLPPGDGPIALGAECSGTVVAAGPRVAGLQVGDEVVAITSSFTRTSLLARYVTLPETCAATRPEHLDAVTAAGQPTAYLTAHYALEELARIRHGDRVLVHSATGGVGLAAVHICRRAGAEVLATAGSDAKRSELRALGIEHVFDSRSTDFAAGVLAATGGRGVDVVLNSLAGPAIEAGLGVLAPGGRFVELGKRDVYGRTRLELGLLRENRALFVVDLAGLTADDPQFVAQMLRIVIARVDAGELPPLPVTASPITEAVDAFRTMAAAEHVGKLVLTAASAPVTVVAPAIRAGATYVITGGTGALGLATARRLVRNGATHLALVARRAPDSTAAAAIAALTAAGVTVRVVLADVGDGAVLASALDMVRAEMPPLRGVFHAAGVLADATLATMDAATLRDALMPKLDGAWNLHLATAADSLDHFVLYSSVAGVLGLRGQANYAAGNAFLDALAVARRAAARPALSIAWGPWLGAGLAAAAANRGDRLAESGLGGLVAGEALDVLDRLLDGPAPTAIVMRFDAAAWAEADPTAAALLDEMTGAANEPAPDGSGDGQLAARLAAVPPGPRRRAVAEDAVCAQLAPVLRLAPERIDRQRTLKAMGLDSLMALELRNRLEAATGLTLSATAAWNHPTVALLAEHLAARLGIPLDAIAPDADLATGGGSDRPAADAAAPADASAEELAAMLRDELAAVERLLDGNGAAS